MVRQVADRAGEQHKERAIGDGVDFLKDTGGSDVGGSPEGRTRPSHDPEGCASGKSPEKDEGKPPTREYGFALASGTRPHLATSHGLRVRGPTLSPPPLVVKAPACLRPTGLREALKTTAATGFTNISGNQTLQANNNYRRARQRQALHHPSSALPLHFWRIVFVMNVSKIAKGVVMIALVAALSGKAEAWHHEHSFMLKYMQELVYTPVLLYQCYRNGTTIEPRSARNVTILFDGLGKREGSVDATILYAERGTGRVTREKAHLKYHHSTDTVTFDTAGGRESEVVLLEFDGYKAHYISETVEGRAPVAKIYDVDIRCTNAQELYKKAESADFGPRRSASCRGDSATMLAYSLALLRASPVFGGSASRGRVGPALRVDGRVVEESWIGLRATGQVAAHELVRPPMIRR
ncbi:hypothetical protein HPB47_002244 [Ixodes persulcatus]|uniref:Uncharacterized protein n=1 Tax=Ixodes persulcatus TaxID=34615 RepID=A0AC60PLS5_IXOPE|nr:hypothetical protein HPB47_002244 [Ixodes persulcatus]